MAMISTIPNTYNMAVANRPLKKLARVYHAKMKRAKEMLKKGENFHSAIAIAEAEVIADKINELSWNLDKG